jgi:hypothetical protein
VTTSSQAEINPETKRRLMPEPHDRFYTTSRDVTLWAPTMTAIAFNFCPSRLDYSGLNYCQRTVLGPVVFRPFSANLNSRNRGGLKNR